MTWHFTLPSRTQLVLVPTPWPKCLSDGGAPQQCEYRTSFTSSVSQRAPRTDNIHIYLVLHYVIPRARNSPEEQAVFLLTVTNMKYILPVFKSGEHSFVALLADSDGRCDQVRNLEKFCSSLPRHSGCGKDYLHIAVSPYFSCTTLQFC